MLVTMAHVTQSKNHVATETTATIRSNS